MPTRFDSMNRDKLRAACRAAGMTGYSRLTLGEMRARLWDREPIEERVVTTMGGDRLEVTPITTRQICENTLQLSGPDSDTRHRDVQDEPRTRHRGRKRRVPSHLRTPARRARFEQRELERQARDSQS